MRLLYVSSTVEGIQLQIINALNKNGIDTKLFTYSMRIRKTTNNNIPREAIRYQLNSHAHGPILYLNRLDRISSKAFGLIAPNSIDVFHANMSFSDGVICQRLSNSFKIPYVVSVRDTDINMPFLWKLPWIKRRGLEVLTRAHAVIFLSPAYKNKLFERLNDKQKAILSEKSYIIPNGIDDFWFDNIYRGRNIKNDDTIKIITSGRINERKNQITVAKALSLLDNKGIKVSYTIVGKTENEEIRKQLDAFSFVTVKDNMPKESLIFEYRNADLFVMPSITETFGLVYAEALSQGLPVIYSKGQGFDGQFEEGVVGYSVESMDSNALADMIIKTYDNRKTLSQNAIDCVGKFRWSSVTDQFRSVYTFAISRYKDNYE